MGCLSETSCIDQLWVCGIVLLGKVYKLLWSQFFEWRNWLGLLLFSWKIFFFSLLGRFLLFWCLQLGYLGLDLLLKGKSVFHSVSLGDEMIEISNLWVSRFLMRMFDRICTDFDILRGWFLTNFFLLFSIIVLAVGIVFLQIVLLMNVACSAMIICSASVRFSPIWFRCSKALLQLNSG